MAFCILSIHHFFTNKCLLQLKFSGWAYDLKTVSEDIIRKRAERTGDGSNAYSKCIKSNTEADSAKKHSHHHHHNPNETLIWGWDDQDMDTDVKNNALIINKFKSS